VNAVPALAFVCAMPMEARPLARKLRLRRADVGGVKGYRKGAVVAVVTGMGPRRAAAATRQLLSAVPVDRVVVVGITGAVDERAPIGSLVVPETVVDGATGAEYRPAPLRGLTNQGRMWTSATIMTEPSAIVDDGVIALDMETAAVAAVCEAHGTPWSVVRAVSDRGLDHDVVGLSSDDGPPGVGAALRYVVRHPGRVAGLVRLGRDAARAAERAAEAAVRATAS